MSSKDNFAGLFGSACRRAGRLKILALCCMLVLSLSGIRAAGQRARDRYVSPTGRDWSNDGSKRHPWRTIEYAGSMAAPGTTIHVLPGTYRLSKIIITRASGTAAARIRYVSEQRWGAKLITSATQVWQNSGAYVDIEGFDISSSSLDTYIGIHSQGSYDRILYNHVHDLGAPPESCPQGGGIMMGDMATTGQEAHGNVVHDVGPPPGACREIHGIYVSAPHCKVTNNLLFRNSGMGIQLWGRPDHCLVANNTIFANGRGLVVGGDPKYGSNDYTVVANNIVYRNVDVGVYESGLIGPNNRFVHNLVYGNKTDWFLKKGRQIGSIGADPRFVRYTGTLEGDYHLQEGSPAIASGAAEFAPVMDYERNPRHTPPDIGAYESQFKGTK
ncbi:MAG: right-handed parallel beta-helix repeat-containing protein [Chlamydiota bacterium]